jgi:hypothetical protein
VGDTAFEDIEEDPHGLRVIGFEERRIQSIRSGNALATPMKERHVTGAESGQRLPDAFLELFGCAAGVNPRACFWPGGLPGGQVGKRVEEAPVNVLLYLVQDLSLLCCRQVGGLAPFAGFWGGRITTLPLPTT